MKSMVQTDIIAEGVSYTAHTDERIEYDLAVCATTLFVTTVKALSFVESHSFGFCKQE